MGVGNDPRYNRTKTFDPFPFPDPDEATRARLRALGEELDATRKTVQPEHPDLTLTGLYNVLEKVRAAPNSARCEGARAGADPEGPARPAARRPGPQHHGPPRRDHPPARRPLRGEAGGVIQSPEPKPPWSVAVPGGRIMGKIIAFILILALGFGVGWVGRSYRATAACNANGGTFDTNRGLCTGVPAIGRPGA